MTDQASQEARARADLPPEIQRFAEQREREEEEAERVVNELENMAIPVANETALPDPAPSFNEILSMNMIITPFDPSFEVTQQANSLT